MNVLAEKFHMSKQSIVSLILANVLVSDVLELLRMELDNAAIAESDRQYQAENSGKRAEPDFQDDPEFDIIDSDETEAITDYFEV